MIKKIIYMNLSKIFLTIVSLLCFYNNAFPLAITHQLRPNGNFDTLALSNACSTIVGTSFSVRCNPALFPYSKGEGVLISASGKSDGDSIDNGRDLIFSPITEELIRKIFQQKNFNTFTLNSDFAFKTSVLEISYSPYYLLADLYLFNPAFPEVSLNLINHESLRLTSGLEVLQLPTAVAKFIFSAGASVYYFEHSYENTVFSLFDLTTTRPENLIKMKSRYGVGADVGFFLDNNSLLFPKLSLQIKNINSTLEDDSSENEAIIQAPQFLFDTYSTIGIGEKFQTAYGRFDLSCEIPFSDYFFLVSPAQIMFSGRYSIGLFSVLGSAGKYYQNVGLRFDSKNFNIGITYSREADMGAEQASMEQAVYTGVDIIL
ncbi:MAG: hypothetical protein A2451_04600 [Bdellovibrionales bacterium RIFOXYC2_FULL_39_8]|nr:MAG: hypothetical protein A2451_04600 [Bdellovibrionales bacterium RIFOXYC2_FULL_39_8]